MVRYGDKGYICISAKAIFSLIRLDFIFKRSVFKTASKINVKYQHFFFIVFIENTSILIQELGISVLEVDFSRVLFFCMVTWLLNWP